MKYFSTYHDWKSFHWKLMSCPFSQFSRLDWTGTKSHLYLGSFFDDTGCRPADLSFFVTWIIVQKFHYIQQKSLGLCHTIVLFVVNITCTLWKELVYNTKSEKNKINWIESNYLGWCNTFIISNSFIIHSLYCPDPCIIFAAKFPPVNLSIIKNIFSWN